MDDVVGVVDGSCTACDGAAASTCSAASCESNLHYFVDGVGCTSCAAIMDDIVGVLDGSCTTCDGAAASSCSAASCESNSHTFVDGAGCSVDCATTGGGAACPSTTTTVSATIYPSL